MNDAADPFDERIATPYRQIVHVLGTGISAASNSRELLRMLDHAFARLPKHRLGRQRRGLQLRLVLRPQVFRKPYRAPPVPRMHAGAGVLMGVVDADNFAVISPATGSATVSVSRDLLRFPYHLRYEVLEFALLTLVARVQGLVPLHAGCVSLGERGLLLNGSSGSGKSTLSAACAAGGFDLLAEDAVFVDPRTLRATGCATFLHLGADSLRFVSDPQLRAAFREAPRIVRRSGARKFELDVRETHLPVAKRPPRLAALVVLSSTRARGSKLLVPISPFERDRVLRRDQPYASAQSTWRPFVERMATLPAYRLNRAPHPEEAVEALRTLLENDRL
jgi:hypothetical protein